jgi:hypothetical protein
MKMFLRVVLLVLLAVACGWPDVAPRPSRGERIKMRIVRDSVADGGPVLEIPSRLLRQHAALLDIAPRLPVGGSGGFRMLAAGVLLSAAVFLFGRAFWKRRERKRLPLVFAFASLLASGAMIRTASADDYTRYDPGTLNAIGGSAPYEGTVAVRVTDDGDAVILHLTPPRQPHFRPHSEPKPEPR